MLTDIKASAKLTASGLFVDNVGNNIATRVRVKALYIMLSGLTGTLGTLNLRNGASGATIFWGMDVPARADCGYFYVILPGEGILFENGVYGELGGASAPASVTIFYG